jgi:hypothetical protein
MLAYGTYLAIGCSPFGIDSLPAQDSPITRSYKLLSSVSNYILEAQANRPEDIMGFFFDETSETKMERNWVRCFGGFELTVDRAFVFGKPGPGEGIIIHQGNGKFWLIGWGFHCSSHIQEHKPIGDLHRNLILGRKDGRRWGEPAFRMCHEWR